MRDLPTPEWAGTRAMCWVFWDETQKPSLWVSTALCSSPVAPTRLYSNSWLKQRTHNLEKCLPHAETRPLFCSVFQNLRLGSIDSIIIFMQSPGAWADLSVLMPSCYCSDATRPSLASETLSSCISEQRTRAWSRRV